MFGLSSVLRHSNRQHRGQKGVILSTHLTDFRSARAAWCGWPLIGIVCNAAACGDTLWVHFCLQSSGLRKTTQLKNMLTSPKLEFIMEAHNGLTAKIVQEAGFKVRSLARFIIRCCHRSTWLTWVTGNLGKRFVDLCADGCARLERSLVDASRR